jgi:hypothetical protein
MAAMSPFNSRRSLSPEPCANRARIVYRFQPLSEICREMKMTLHHRLLGGLQVVLVALGAGPAAAQQEAKRAISKIAGDLYRFHNNFHYSVFLVTPDGVIATDPINAEAAGWLKKEIARRFGKPVEESSSTLVEWSSSWEGKGAEVEEFCHNIYVHLLADLKETFA